MTKEELTKQLLDIKAVFLRPNEPFTWASGIKSPIYCDIRLTLAYPKLFDEIANMFVMLIKKEFSDVEVIVGTATAGIPHATILANKLNLPLCYVRSSKKDHGRNNQIEGAIIEGKKVLIIEDTISTGKSSNEVIMAVKEQNANVLALLSVYTYNLEKALNLFKDNNIKTKSLIDFDYLINEALNKKYITCSEFNILKEFKQKINN